MFPTFGERLLVLGQTASTQDDAKRLVETRGAEAAGTAVYTEHQTAGRGRFGRAWHAPRGANVCLTVIAGPVPFAQLWRVTFVTGVAVADALCEFATDTDVRLRFPNDILLNGKKVGGILVEAESGSGIPAGTSLPLIGIGINVRGDTDVMPPDVAVRATTIARETGATLPLADVRDTILRSLSATWEDWSGGGSFASILARWDALHDRDSRRIFILDGEPVSCRVNHISEEGHALIELPDGATRRASVSQIILG